MQRQLARLAIVVLALGCSNPASAVPVLQLFIEGAKYDADAQSWVITERNFNLLVIGNTGAGSIAGVRLAAAFVTGETGSINITPTTTSLFSDPSGAPTPVLDLSLGADGTLPQMITGQSLPAHGVYGPGTSFMQWSLGDFTLADSPIGDFIYEFPTSMPATGQVNAYSVSISGYSRVAFDAFDHALAERRAYFAPFTTDSVAVPEPNILMLLGAGGILVSFLGRRRTKR